jgi:hypothetical protein
VLKEVELQLWQVILHLAKSASGDTVSALKSAFEKIDAFLGEGVDIADIDWFDSGKKVRLVSYSAYLEGHKPT